ncbi:hypothetical protein V6Z11_A05G257600 [Gossypium hirsutum]
MGFVAGNRRARRPEPKNASPFFANQRGGGASGEGGAGGGRGADVGGMAEARD